MSNYPLFSVVGIEIEYMLVNQSSLDVQPLSDKLLAALSGGKLVNEVELGDISISNELVMHVIELKNNGPQPPTVAIADQFQNMIQQLQPLLRDYQLQLLPTGAHPWMDPLKETQCWPHGDRTIYQKYDSIFNCRGHGWSNLQSTHINLPFSNDQEFSQLHNAIRLLLPLLPALAASTPFLEGKKTGFQSSRLDFYGKNQKNVPQISGDIIPEFICSEEEYQNQILTPMYHAISPYDPQGILQYEWLNSRAAIPKFNYGAIEIRILDSQECVQADIALALVVFAILKEWQSTSDYYLKRPYETKSLKAIYDQTIKEGMAVFINDEELIRQWQLPVRPMSVQEVWVHLIEKVSSRLDLRVQRTLEHLLSQGNLSERLVRAYSAANRPNLKSIYQELSQCLLNNQLFGSR